MEVLIQNGTTRSSAIESVCVYVCVHVCVYVCQYKQETLLAKFFILEPRF